MTAPPPPFEPFRGRSAKPEMEPRAPSPREEARGEIPPAVLRLFPHHPVESLLTPEGRSLLIARLLEDGDRQDLAWMWSVIDPSEVRAWFEARGGRQLSRRSRTFWEVLLGLTHRPSPTPAEELWPL
jgi:hypothetical protein